MKIDRIGSNRYIIEKPIKIISKGMQDKDEGRVEGIIIVLIQELEGK